MTTTSQDTAGPTAEEIAGLISRFVTEHTKASWEPDTDLFDGAGLSSLFAMELVVFLENSFGIEIAGSDLRLDNFRTIALMTRLVLRLRETSESGESGESGVDDRD